MEQQQQQPHRHMLAASVSRRELPPPTTSTSTTTTTTTATNQSLVDLGPPPALPRLHPTAHNSSSPPAYSHSALPVRFPDVPTADLPLPRPRPSMSHNDVADQVLPSLSALQSLRADRSLDQPHWPVLNPIKSFPSPAQAQLPKMESPDTMELDASSNSVISAASPDRMHELRASSVSLDDPDVRLAAEALGDLRADFVSSPPSTSNGCALLPVSPTTPVHQQPQQPEPLLSLLTTSHPLLATTIGSATSAYGGAKNFSPRFKSSAEYVEGYLTPIANTVGSVGRVTGVEGGVRWFLGAGRRGNSSSDLEAGSSKKRRKMGSGLVNSSDQVTMDNGAVSPVSGQPQPIMDTVVLQDSMPPTPKGDRRLSMASTDTLPAYDELRSPAYTESHSQKSGSQNSTAPWQSRLIMSTSGLSVAMSDESLRSLKYCLSWLRWANSHMARVIGALKDTLEQYDNAANAEQQQAQLDEKHGGMVVDVQPIQPPAQSRSELVARIDSLKGDVVKTLQDVVNTVSKYAGGALPENARVLVRRHLTSLPQRFRIATMSESSSENGDKDSESAIRDGAHKILVLAKEGLDMVTQVSGVVDGTIVSAEDWCERMGKKRRADKPGQQEMLLPQTEPNGDVKMG